MKIPFLAIFYSLIISSSLLAQNPNAELLQNMRRFEKSVIATYRAYQWLYYEEKQSQAELLAFEDLMGVYVKRLREAYETMSLIGQEGIDDARDITARAYIYRALTFLEKAPIDITYFERACYDYYEALQLYDFTTAVPVVFKSLPDRLRIGTKTYDRLIDLLDEKGKDLFAFGQVHLSLKNFKVTSDFDEQTLRLVRYEKGKTDSLKYTYNLAENRLKEGFRKAFQSDEPVDINLALPAGIYYIRSQKNTPTDYINLATLYVQPNQFISYIVEPIADWVIFYESPEYLPNLQSAQKDSLVAQAAGLDNGTVSMDSSTTFVNKYPYQNTQNSLDGEARNLSRGEKRIAKILARLLEDMSLDDLEKLPIPRTRKEFIHKVARIIANRATGEFLNSWSRWTFAWNVAKQTTQNFAPESPVSSSMVKLAHRVIKEIY